MIKKVAGTLCFLRTANISGVDSEGLSSIVRKSLLPSGLPRKQMSGCAQDNRCGKSRGKQQRQTTPLAMPNNALLMTQRFTFRFMPDAENQRPGANRGSALKHS